MMSCYCRYFAARAIAIAAVIFQILLLPGRSYGEATALFKGRCLAVTDKLYISDDTPEGMHVVKEGVYPSAGYEYHGPLFVPTADGSRCFFPGIDPVHGNSLWVTDGTEAGTLRLTDRMSHDDGRTPGISPTLIRPFRNGVLVLSSFDGEQKALWFSDGTVAGTRPLIVLPVSQWLSDFEPWVILRDVLYFCVRGSTASELWRSDGTGPGTRKIQSFDWFNGEFFQAASDRVCFVAGGAKQGWQLWSTDGTTAGTRSIENFRIMQRDSLEAWVAGRTESHLFFMAKTPGQGRELWSTDGTAAGTGIVKNLSSGKEDADIRVIGTIGNRLCFSAPGKNLSQSFWTTDGTPNGAQMKDIYAGAYLGNAGGYLYFVTAHGDPYLGVTDGMINGTPYPNDFSTSFGSVRDFRVGKQGGFSFSTMDRTSWNRDRVWVSDDGSPGSIRPVLEDVPLLSQRGIKNMIGWNGKFLVPHGKLYDAGEVRHLDVLCHDPVAGVTEDIFPYEVPDVTWHLTSGSRAVFSFTSSSFPIPKIKLWGTDGTTAGSGMLAEMPAELAAYIQTAEDRMWFLAPDPSRNGSMTFWKTDGSLPGTVALRSSAVSSNVPRLDIGEDSVIDLSAQVLNQPRVRILHVQNTGDTALTDIVFSSPGLAEYEITPAGIAILAPGAVADIQITFTPHQAGLREATMQLSSISSGGSSTPVSRTIYLRGRGLPSDAAPETVTAPRSCLALTGQPVTFAAEIVAPAGVTASGWQRSPGMVLAEEEPILSLPGVRAEDVGTYTYAVSTPAGALTTPPASLGVVTPAAITNLKVPVNKGFQLSCTAQAPADSTLSYQWTFKGTPMSPGGRIQGSKTASLRVDFMSEADVGDYECLVTLHAPDRSFTLSHGHTAITMLLPPEVIVKWDASFFVGKAVSYQVTATRFAEIFTFEGLPPGLTGDASGLVTGRPTKAQPLDPETGFSRAYNVIVTARNAAGVSEPAIIPMFVLPVSLAGSYNGLIDRHSDILGGKNLGGKCTLSITTSGSFSGQLVHGGKSYRFASPRNASDIPAPGASVDYEIPVSYAANQPPLRLTVGGYGGETCFCNLKDAQGREAVGILERQVTRNATEMELVAGIYNCLISPYSTENSDLTTPAGTGYLILKAAKTGTATWAGKLADGIAITGSGPLVKELDPQVNLHCPLYHLTGSLHGYFNLSYGAIHRGFMDWMKAPEVPAGKSRSYKEGIPLHRVDFLGHTWTKPGKNQLFWDLQYVGYNLQILLTGEGLPEEGLLQFAGIDQRHRVILPLSERGNVMRKLSLSASSGVFKGSFRLYTPASPPRPVDIPFEGVFAGDAARGFFLIPEIAEDGSVSKTSPLHSGTIKFEPHTPD